MERPNRQGIQFTGNYIIIFRYIPDTSQRKTPAQDVTRQYQSGVDSDFLVTRNYQYLTVCFRIAVQPYDLGMFTMKSEHCKSQVGVRCRFDSCHLHHKRRRTGSSQGQTALYKCHTHLLPFYYYFDRQASIKSREENIAPVLIGTF